MFSLYAIDLFETIPSRQPLWKEHTPLNPSYSSSALPTLYQIYLTLYDHLKGELIHELFFLELLLPLQPQFPLLYMLMIH